MADIVTTLDKLIQPNPPSRKHPQRFVFDWEVDERELDVVQAQLQYDLIDRAYFHKSILPPLSPRVFGKAIRQCTRPSCLEGFAFTPGISSIPQALETTGLHAMYKTVIPYVPKTVPVKTKWVSQRRQPATWDLYDKEMKAVKDAWLLMKYEGDIREGLVRPPPEGVVMEPVKEVVQETAKEDDREQDQVPWQAQFAEIEEAQPVSSLHPKAASDRPEVPPSPTKTANVMNEPRSSRSPLNGPQRLLRKKTGRSNLNPNKV